MSPCDPQSITRGISRIGGYAGFGRGAIEGWATCITKPGCSYRGKSEDPTAGRSNTIKTMEIQEDSGRKAKTIESCANQILVIASDSCIESQHA